MKGSSYSVRDICIIGVMAAIVFILTVVPRVPIPLGYAHLGDGAIMLAGFYGGKKKGALAAAIGSALSDALSGFPIWIIPTFIIKYFMGWSAASDAPFFSVKTGLHFLGTCAILIVGYTIAGAILYGGIEVGLTSTPGLCYEALINIVAAYAVGALLEKTPFGKMMKK